MIGGCGNKTVTVKNNTIYSFLGTLSSVQKIWNILPVLWSAQKNKIESRVIEFYGSMERICDVCREYCDNDSDNNINALQEAIRSQHVKYVKTLVEAGADVKSETKYCDRTMTLLEAAVRSGNVEIMKVLIDAGADVNTSTTEPMIVTAVRFGYVEIVKTLIEAGADINPLTTLIQDNPLAQAALDKNTECLNFLLEAGADVNHVHNKVALAISALSGYDGCMSLLIDAGADVNHKYKNGKSALFLATENCYIKCMKLLLKKGAEVTCVKYPFRHFLNHLSPRHQKAMGKPFWLLLAAGVDSVLLNLLFPKSSFTYPLEQEMSLMDLCRQFIRKHLLQMSPLNLFVQVPQLGLPTLLQEYLLFNVALDDE